VSQSLTCRLPLTEAFQAEYLEHNGVLPLELDGGRLRVAVRGQPAVEVLDDLELTFDAPLELVEVGGEELREGIRRAYAAAESTVELVRDLGDGAASSLEGSDSPLADARDLANQPPVIRFVNLLIREAYQTRASDIHLEATPEGLRTRFRVDGALGDVTSPPRAIQAAVISRVKLLAELDIAERRLSQDGRIRVRLEERDLDLRISTVPTLHGESVVMRLLDRGGRPVGMDELGMSPQALAALRALASRPHGIVLATGPTGCGKTTTLYAALSLRDGTREKVITVEDPVEYRLTMVTQVPINEKAGMTFGSALRSILRQDPDVLMVGEMRDPVTAATAVRAAMTGHLVFSTLHTNDAVAAVMRLKDLGIEPYMTAAALEGVLAQRLVRRICSDCAISAGPVPAAVSAAAGVPGGLEAMRGAGCGSCAGTGFRGRSGIFELLVATEAVREAIAAGRPAADLRALAAREGMRTMRQDGMEKVRAGVTTVEEVLRVTEQ
jgi:general secretion pathway protein E